MNVRESVKDSSNRNQKVPILISFVLQLNQIINVQATYSTAIRIYVQRKIKKVKVKLLIMFP